MSKILITGASGLTGGKVIPLLIQKGHAVRAMVRKKDERSEKLAKLGAEIVLGDFLDSETVEKAVKGVERAYFCYPIAPGLIQATSYFAQAAKDERLEAIVNMSQISARKDSASHVAHDHWIAEQVFNWSGLNVTHLRPTFFAEWMMYMANEISEGKMYTALRNNRHAPIAAADQVKVIAAILDEPSKHAGKVYPLHGPVEVTQEQIAEELSKALGIKVEYKYVETPVYLQTMAEANARAPKGAGYQPEYSDSLIQYIAQHLHAMSGDYENGLIAGTNNVVQEIAGVPGTTVKAWINENRHLFHVKEKV